MKFLKALVIITACIFLSCSKTSTPPPKGTLVFQNNSTNPYQVVVNGKSVIDMQPGHTKQSISYPSGMVTISVMQLEGYFITPTQKTYKGDLKTGGTLFTAYP